MSRKGSAPTMSGGELALRLFGAFRDLVDDAHAELAHRGHPDVRPVHGFALQAIGTNGATAGELGARLGVSKQAAGKTVDALVNLGYVTRTTDPADARRKVVALTVAGHDLLAASGAIFDRLRDDREHRVGEDLMRNLEAGLRRITTPGPDPLDTRGWWASS